MDLDMLLRSQPLLIAFATFVLGAMGWAFRQHLTQLLEKALAEAATRSSVDALAIKVASHADRLMTIETAMQHLPTAAQVHGLTVAISDLRGELRAVGENVEGLDRQLSGLSRRLDLIDDHLRNGKP
jgi:hypothetical protein